MKEDVISRYSALNCVMKCRVKGTMKNCENFKSCLSQLTLSHDCYVFSVPQNCEVKKILRNMVNIAKHGDGIWKCKLDLTDLCGTRVRVKNI